MADRRAAATGAFAMFLSFSGDRAEALYDAEPGEISGKPGTLIRVVWGSVSPE
jgi:hypothetical protein